jgi:ubiquinone/menaquinone biosynthesis C-methylase UbiE
VTHQHNDTPTVQTEGILIPWAKYYDLLTNILTFGQAKRLRKLTVDLTLLKSGESILDLGCGTGGVTIPAKERIGPAGKAFGIDPSPEMIAIAKEKVHGQNLDIDLRVGVIEAIPFPGASFDVVTSSLMMHHLPKQLQLKGAAEVYRVLKPGGRWLVADMIRPKTTARLGVLLIVALHHGWPFDGEDLRNLMAGAGFQNVVQLEERFSAIGFMRAIK